MEEIVVEGPSSLVSEVDDKVQARGASHDGPPQWEIQHVGADYNEEALNAPHDVPSETEMEPDASRKAAMEQSDQWVNAIENGDNLKVKELLEKDKSCLWKYEKEGRTALTIAAEVDDYDLVYIILGALMKAQRESKTCFFFQVLNPASDFISLTDYIEKSNLLNLSPKLLELIEDNRRDSLGDWYSVAVEQRDWATLLNMLNTSEFLRIFVDYRQQRTLLHVAAMHGRFSLVKELLEKLTSEVGTPAFAKNKVINFIMAVDPQTKLTALQMADDIIGNRSISELIKLTLRFLNSSENTFRVFVGNQREWLFEAYPHTQWYKELKMYVKRCREMHSSSGVESRMIRHSLQLNSRLLLETFHGLSALHLAILSFDRGLVEAIMALFGREGKIEWGHSYYLEALSWEQMCEAKRLDGVEFDWASFHMTELNLLPYYNISARKIADIARKIPDISDNQDYLKYLNSGEGIITTSLPEHSRTFCAMNDYINQEWNVNHEEWQKGFEADRDFNFEDEPRRSLLRVHYACKDPLQFRGFLESVSKHESFNDFSTRMHDAKGRTLHHVLLDHYSTDKHPGWAFTEIFSSEVSKFCIKHAQDSRGRRLMDVLIGKNCLQHNVFLKPYSYFYMKFEQDGERREDYAFLGNYYIASALQQTIIASQPTWVEVLLQTDLKNGKELKLLPFVTATSTNQTMLHALSRIEPQVELMVQDQKKRTLLHYAADPTSLNFETLLDMASDFERSMIYNCFSTVEDYCEFQRKLSSKIDMGIDSNDQSSLTHNEKNEITQSNVRRRACILMLLQAGLDLSQRDDDRKVPSIGPTSDADYQTWWYDLVVKDATDNKNSFNQAGNALSVVGTLVAATSYIGPLQPPMSYTEGLVRYSEKLVEVFMVTNTLAFFLAMASVMFAVVPSLPMPRESVMSELRRARQMVSVSLCLLLVAIAAIIVSFSAASVVVSQYEDTFPRSNILIGPLLVGWSICLIAVTSFFIRILRLSFYENAVVQTIYQFSLRKFCLRTLKSYFRFLVRDFCKFTLIGMVYLELFDFTSPNPNGFLDYMKIALLLLCVVFYEIFASILFPIYHVFHIVVLIPCKLIVHCVQFRRRHEHGW